MFSLGSRTSKQVSRNLGPLWYPGVYYDTNLIFLKDRKGRTGLCDTPTERPPFVWSFCWTLGPGGPDGAPIADPGVREAQAATRSDISRTVKIRSGPTIASPNRAGLRTLFGSQGLT